METSNEQRIRMGVRPVRLPSKEEWKRLRLTKLGTAIERTTQRGDILPQEWVEEYNELLEELEADRSEKLYSDARDAFRSYAPPHYGVKDMRWGTPRPVRGPRQSDFVSTDRVCYGHHPEHHKGCQWPTVNHPSLDVDNAVRLDDFCGGNYLVGFSQKCPNRVNHDEHMCAVVYDTPNPAMVKKTHVFDRYRPGHGACGVQLSAARGHWGSRAVTTVTCDDCKQMPEFKEAASARLPERPPVVTHLTRGVRNDDLVPRCGATAIPLVTKVTGERALANCEDCLRAVIEPETPVMHFTERVTPGRLAYPLCGLSAPRISMHPSLDMVTCEECKARALQRGHQLPVHQAVKFSFDTRCGLSRETHKTTIVSSEVTCETCKKWNEDRHSVHAAKGPCNKDPMCGTKIPLPDVADAIWAVTCTKCYDVATGGRGK